MDTQKCKRNWKKKTEKKQSLKIEFSKIEIFKKNKQENKNKFDDTKLTLNETLPRNQGLYFGLDSDDLVAWTKKVICAKSCKLSLSWLPKANRAINKFN